MKIALLGAPSSGKTVYFSAVYHRFRNVITLPILTPSQKAYFIKNRIEQQMGFRLNVHNMELEETLSSNGDLLMEQPITQWPEGTKALNKANLTVSFDFVPLSVTGTTPGTSMDHPDARINGRPRSYARALELYDPPGGVFKGAHYESKEIITALLECDMAIAFIPTDKLLELDRPNVDENDWAAFSAKVVLGKMMEVLSGISTGIGESDIFPICFVLSKFDLLLNGSSKPTSLIEEMVYDRLLVPLSQQFPRFMICVCPISVVDPVSGCFKAVNLEWPFLFATGGTLLRNFQELSADAAKDRQQAEAAARTAAELVTLRRKSLWGRFKRWWVDGQTAGMHTRIAERYMTSAGRKIFLAEDDRLLARDIWASVAGEGRDQRGIRVLMGGEFVDPRIGAL